MSDLPEHTARGQRAEAAAATPAAHHKYDSTPPLYYPPPDSRRAALLDELAHYAAAWIPEITKRRAAFAKERGREPNAVMVPPGFAAVAAGSMIAGLAVITPALVEDWALELPYVCYTILPKEVSR